MDWSVSSPRFTSLAANSQLLFVCPQLPLSLASLGPAAAAAMSPTTASTLPLNLCVRVCMRACNSRILLLLFSSPSPYSCRTNWNSRCLKAVDPSPLQVAEISLVPNHLPFIRLLLCLPGFRRNEEMRAMEVLPILKEKVAFLSGETSRNEVDENRN